MLEINTGKMNSTRKPAIIVGILFITATLSWSIGDALLTPILSASDYLINIYPNRTRVIIGVLFELINCTTVIVIPVMMFPIFNKDNEGLALGYLGFRIIESIILIVGIISLLSLLTLSQDYLKAAAPRVSNFQTLGTLLQTVDNWTYLLGIEVFFPLGALILNYLLYQSELIPRFISGWGLIGAPMVLASALLVMFGLINPSSTIHVVLMLPIAVQEMVFAVWLIVKGFNPAVLTSDFKRSNPGS